MNRSACYLRWLPGLCILLICAVLSVPALSSASEPPKAPADKTGPGDQARQAPKPGPPTADDKSHITKEHDEITILKNRIIELRNKGKLGFRKIVRCKSIEGFGAYTPFESGDRFKPILVYIEPSNVSTLVSNGKYIINCTVDILFFGPNGKIRGGKKSAVTISRVARSPIIDLYFKFGIRPGKRRPGPMAVKIVLHDRIKEASASFTLRLIPKSRKEKSREHI